MRSLLNTLTLCSFIGFSVTTLAGEQWEYKTQMKSPEMEAMGMKMPAMTSKICKDAGWDAPPQDKEKQNDCKVTAFKHDGSHMIWDMQCKEGKAHGEMTLQGSDNFTGFTEFSSKDGNMRMDMSGHKLGSCDAGTTRNVVNGKEMPNAAEMGQMKKNMDQQRQQGEQMMAKSQADMKQRCNAAVSDMNAMMFMGSCPDQTAEFCKRVQTDDGLLKLSTAQMGLDAGLDTASKACNSKLDKDTAVARVCKQAQAKDNWDALKANCPADSKAMMKKHCHKETMGEMTEVTANEARYKKLCAGADEDMFDDNTSAPSAKDIMKKEGLNAAKGLLKF